MWKKIKNFPNYEINETGEIKNIKRNKLLKPTSNKAGKGYLYVSLYNKGYEIHNEKMKKPVLQIDYYTKEIVNKFDSIREASKSTGIASSNIVDNLKNRQTHTKGFIWCYAYKEE